MSAAAPARPTRVLLSPPLLARAVREVLDDGSVTSVEPHIG